MVVPLTVWPFRNFGSWHLPSEAGPRLTSKAPIAVSQSDLQMSCGRWLDAAMCAVCKSRDNLLYCGFHQIVLCGKCFNHDPCHSVLECVVQVDDLESGAQQVEDYKEALDFLSFLQLIGPTRNLASAMAQVWGLEEQHATRSTRRQAQSETPSPTLDLPCAVAGPDCGKAMVFCSSCSQMLCLSCSGEHGPSECTLFDMPAIRALWYNVTERLDPPEEALQVLASIPQGQQIAQRLNVEVSKIPEVRLDQISVLAGLRFTKACRHLEQERFTKTAAAPAPAPATLDQARVKTARRLMREWELGSTDEHYRAAVVAQAKIFLKADERAEEKSVEAKQAEAKQAEAKQAEAEEQSVNIDAEAKDNEDADAKLNAEYDRLKDVLDKAAPTYRLENCRWQAVNPAAVVAPHPNKACKLIWLDPFYQEQHQPVFTELTKMRELLDALSQEGTLVLIFGRPELLYSRWAPLFEDGYSKSKARWAIDPSLFFVHRQRLRDKQNSNFRVWHSMTEAILTVVRKEKKGKKFVIPNTRNYTPEFKQKYGDLNGSPTNVFSNYHPPTSKPRLRDDEGVKLRTNAEKTPLICEYFLDLLTKEGGGSLRWDGLHGPGVSQDQALLLRQRNR